MENGNWILLAKKITNWKWFKYPEMVQMWIYLLSEAKYKPTRFAERVIERGQLLTTRKELVEKTGLSERQVRTCLQRLQRTGEINIKTTSQNTLVTICKYGDYQDYEPTERPTNDQQTTNERPTKDQQTTNERPTYNINNKTIKQINKITNSVGELTLLGDGGAPENESGSSEVEVLDSEDLTAYETESETKEKSSAKKESGFFDISDTNTTAVVDLFGNVEKMPETAKNRANIANKLNFAEILEWFNAKVEGTPIPKILKFTPKRETNFRNAVRTYGLEKINKLLDLVINSPFLTGNSDSERSWVADFDFIFNANRIPQILEGKYNKKFIKHGQKSSSPVYSDEEIMRIVAAGNAMYEAGLKDRN